METIFTAVFITPNNQMKLANIYRKKTLTRSPLSKPEFEVGNVIVIRHVTLADPFDALCWEEIHESFWICNRSEFDRTFDINEYDPKNEMALIAPIRK